MHSSRLALVGRVLVALLAALASGGIAAAAAQAVEAPRWSIEGSSLAGGETHFITAKAYKAFKLAAGNVTMECTAAKLKEGLLLGTAAGNAGKNNEVIEFSTCKVEGKAGGKTIEKCKVNEPIITNHVKSELVETEKSEPEKENGSLLTLFEPESGSTFATLKFTTETGGNCPPETKVTGKVAGQALTDPENGELGKLVELAQIPAEAKSLLVNFPSTPIKKVTRIASGTTSEVAVSGLTAFSEEAVLTGTALLSLAKKNSKGEFEVEEEADWGFVVIGRIVEAERTGGAGMGTRRCKFMLKLEACTIEVKNLSAVEEEVRESEITSGNATKFGFKNNGCTVGTKLKAAPALGCTVEVWATEDPPIGTTWVSFYYVKVRQIAAPNQTEGTGIGLAI